MKKLLTAIVLTALVPSVWAVTYDDTITAIYGGGNPDTGWTSESGGGIELALRGKNRDTGATPNVNGVYTFPTGFAVSNPARALWNYEFSINSGTPFLDYYDYFLSVDLDPTAGVSYVTFDPLASFADNSYGDAGTANGAGVEGTAAALAGSNFIAQNSQNIVFLGLNPLLDATYNYELYAVAKGAGVGGSKLADVGITVVVGQGGAGVPDVGSTLPLLALGAAGLVGFGFRKRV